MGFQVFFLLRPGIMVSSGRFEFHDTIRFFHSDESFLVMFYTFSMAIHMKAGKIFIDDYRISFVFATEDPFVEDDLKIGLKKRGFNIEVGSRIINAPPFRAVRADIAKKGNVSVLYDNEVSFVGITGKSFKEVRDCFDALGETLSELDQIMFSNQKDVELVLRAHVWTKKDPQK